MKEYPSKTCLRHGRRIPRPRADGKVGDFPRPRMTVSGALRGQRGGFIGSHVLQPFGHCARPDAVTPMIFARETTSRPAHHGDMKVAQRRHHVIAKAAHIGNRRCFPDPYPFVDAWAEMPSELAIDVPVDLRARFIGVYYCACGSRLAGRGLG